MRTLLVVVLVATLVGCGAQNRQTLRQNGKQNNHVVRKIDQNAEIAKLREKARANPKDALIHEQLSVLLDSPSTRAEAFREIKVAISLSPTRPWYRYRLGEMQERTGAFASAQQSYACALALMERTGTDTEHSPLFYAASGRIADRLGHFADAEMYYQKALDSLDRPEVEALYRLPERQVITKNLNCRLRQLRRSRTAVP